MNRAYVLVNDRMQRDYRYALSAPAGCDFADDFRPELTQPKCWRSASSAANT